MENRSEQSYQYMSEIFKVLGTPSRLKILDALSDGERSVSYLRSSLDINAMVLSNQLRFLSSRLINLVVKERRGNIMLYSLNPSRAEELKSVMSQVGEMEAK